MSLSNAFPRMTSCAAGISGVVVLLVSGCLSGTSHGSEPSLGLTRDGQPKATIVISRDPTRSAEVAAAELRDHIQKITGAVLPIVADTATVSGTRILVGASDATRTFGLRNEDFKTQEYMIGVRDGTLVLMGRDGSTPKPAPIQDFNRLKITLDLIPKASTDFEDEHGSCYAVYDFLQRDCGVRWYAPTELGMVYPTQPTLTVKVAELRRTPAVACRFTGIDPAWGYPNHGGIYALLNNPDRLEASLWLLRLKFGGKMLVAGHGFYGYYDRFWEKNPKNLGVFEGEHPEYFARGYKGLPPQLRYSSPALVAQVAKDICDYFKTGKNPLGLYAGKDWVSVEPMDNDSYDKEDAKVWFPNLALGTKAADDVFMSGKYSDYIFQFANAVQKEVSKTCPDGHVFVLAYDGHGLPPSFPVDPKIYVGPCLSARMWLAPGDPAAYKAWIEKELKDPRSEVSGYKAWVKEKKKSGRVLSMWVYMEFPMCYAEMRGFAAFPGFNARALAHQLGMYANDGIDGVYTGINYSEQLGTYVQLKYLDNPDQDIDAVLAEFYSRYYGKAGEAIGRIYNLMEDTYEDHANYPASFHIPNHQTEEIAWKYLGTEERMATMGKWMEEARAAKVSDVEKQRVTVFDTGVWKYLVDGRRQWLNKSEHVGDMEKLKQSPPPTAKSPAIPDAGGDLGKVDWSKAGHFTVANTHEGYPAERQIAVDIAHDANYLYLRLSDPVARDKVKVEGGVFDGDRWEVFVAAQCGAKDYRQIGVKPDGRLMSYIYPGGEEFDSGIQVKCQLSDKGWIAELAVPLALVRALPQASGDTVYLNLYRPASSGQSTLAWSPNFGNAYNTSARLGAVTLGK